MSYTITDFTNQAVLSAKIFYADPNRVTELNAIISALNPDPTTHDTTIETAPAGVQPGNVLNTPFAGEVIRLVNRGKAGNLTNAAMATALSQEIAAVLPPVNTGPPVASGTGTVGSTLNVTTGAWSNFPASYTYQWLRGAATIAGATASSYVLVAADSGNSVSCRVTATNPTGSASTTSNAIAIA